MMQGQDAQDQWDLWEVFVQERAGQPHEHAGSLRAPDAELALQNARDVYARRGRPESLWVVRTRDIHATTPGDAGVFFDGPSLKAYRHPQFYHLPGGMKDQ